MPLRLREIGSSGGLNLRPDSYWYEQDGQGWGNDHSTVRFVDLWRGGSPPFAHGFDVADRRGCDRDPIDATSRGGGLTLLSYVWPEPPERFRRARAALTQAGETPVVIDRADADRWVGAELAAPQPGTTLVFFHSVVWQYFDEATRAAVRDQLDRGAGRDDRQPAGVAAPRAAPCDLRPGRASPDRLGRSGGRPARAAARHHRLPRRTDHLARRLAPASPPDPRRRGARSPGAPRSSARHKSGPVPTRTRRHCCLDDERGADRPLRDARVVQLPGAADAGRGAARPAPPDGGGGLRRDSRRVGPASTTGPRRRCRPSSKAAAATRRPP